MQGGVKKYLRIGWQTALAVLLCGGLAMAQSAVEMPGKNRTHWDQLRLNNANMARKGRTLFDQAAALELPTRYTLKKDARVLGWYPHFVDEAYRSVNFSLLSDLVYYSYEVEAKNGNSLSIHDWEAENWRKVAKAQNPNLRIWLAVSFPKGQDIKVFLNDPTAMNTLIARLTEVVPGAGVGAILDFEELQLEDQEVFMPFLNKLKNGLAAKKLQLGITLNTPNPAENLNVAALGGIVDLLVVKAYNYRSKQQNAGSLDPITGDSNSLTQTLLSYPADSSLRQKTIFTYPYFGAVWQTQSSALPARALKLEGIRTYAEIRGTYQYTSRRDTVKGSPYYNFALGNSESSMTYTQVWFDDSASLAQKYKLTLDHGMGGVGIWALGYDQGYPELNNLLAARFAVPDTTTKALEIPAMPKLDSENLLADLNELSKYRVLLLLIVWILVLFFILGVAALLLHEDAVDFLLRDLKYIGAYHVFLQLTVVSWLVLFRQLKQQGEPEFEHHFTVWIVLALVAAGQAAWTYFQFKKRGLLP